MTKLDLCNLSTSQRCAIRCAFADLIGAYQAHQQNDMHVHDWDAHYQSILDLAECFGFNEDLVKANI